MCTLAIYFKAFADYPIIVAANRDEYLARPALPPTTLAEKPHIVGGKDLRASGTWLGLNEYGMVAGLLNRRNGTAENDPNLRSRGLLCLDVLHCSTVGEAARFVADQNGRDYNPFNLLVASRDQAFVAYNRWNHIEIVNLGPGLHLLTNLDVDDFECPRISRSRKHFEELCNRTDFASDPVGHREYLRRLLADHSTQLDPRSGRPNSLCLHLGDYGTRSSSLIFLGRQPQEVAHFFAAGPPCTASHQPAVLPRAASPRSVEPKMR
jgi:uncharacterized protein with NRDE domain